MLVLMSESLGIIYYNNICNYHIGCSIMLGKTFCARVTFSWWRVKKSHMDLDEIKMIEFVQYMYIKMQFNDLIFVILGHKCPMQVAEILAWRPKVLLRA